MGWLVRDRRGSAWKQGWIEGTLASFSIPPWPLLAIFSIIVVLLSISSYTSFKYQMQKTIIGFKLVLLFIPLLFIFIANFIMKYDKSLVISRKTKRMLVDHQGNPPWGVALLLVILLVLLSYQSYFHSLWWPPIWNSYY